jgi:hypothetical protein
MEALVAGEAARDAAEKDKSKMGAALKAARAHYSVLRTKTIVYMARRRQRHMLSSYFYAWREVLLKGKVQFKVKWLLKSRNRMTIPIQRSYFRNMLLDLLPCMEGDGAGD